MYCLAFISIFWLFSAGVYYWVDKSFGESYVSKVKNQQIEHAGDIPFDSKSAQTVTIAGDIALGQLKEVLVAFNVGMIIVIPGLALLLTERTLRPIEKTYEKQKRFVSDASHELRTPLTIMQGEIDVTLMQPRSPKEYQQALVSTREEVARLHELTESLLTIARGDQQPVQDRMEEVDIIDALTEVVSRLEPLAASKKLHLTFEPPTTNLSVNGSPAALKQLFTNLVENAIKFTPSGGSVTVNANASDKYVQILVADTGIGIKPAAAKLAFERFYRDDNARAEKGFGLGLSICRTIVEQHGGKIALESTSGKGTTVTVLLPAA
jgi:signal transduction histidine kinase